MPQIKSQKKRVRTNNKAHKLVVSKKSALKSSIKAVLAAVDALSSENGMNISKRRITISTSGIIPGIERILRERIPVELAVSLHSVFDNVRSEMIPINKSYPLKDLMDVLTEYQMVTKRRISFEYVLINEFNSSTKDAEALADFVINFDHVINLIPYNPVEGSGLTRPHPEKIKRFYSYLKDQRKLNVTIRVEKGSDIAGACGQLKEKHRSWVLWTTINQKIINLRKLN